MASGKKHFYAVVRGRKPGVYTQWTGPGGAQEQVEGYPGALYRGFATREEAAYFVRTGGKTLPAATLPGIELGLSEPEADLPALDHRPDLAAGKVVIFTDGASTGNPGPGGYGVVMLYGRTRKELSGGFACTTNNRMELMAAIEGLKALKRPCKVCITTDSVYVKDGISQWLANWKRNGWRTSQKQPVKNADLWQQLDEQVNKHQVEWRWVKGHSGHRENELADQLANQGVEEVLACAK